MSADVVLAVNAGSSSLKVSLFAAGGGEPETIARAGATGVGHPDGHVWLEHDGKRTEHALDTVEAFAQVLALVDEAKLPRPTLAGHRVVHGGPHLEAPVRIDAEVSRTLHDVALLVPLHMPPALAAIDAVGARFPRIPQVACFDTAFHAAMPDVARRVPLPERYLRSGVRRYGFHGLSYEYVMSTLGAKPPSRVIIAHLGSGSSLVAVHEGRSVDTTMGFTPAGGVVMGTRSGDLDPGVLVHLLRRDGLSADDLERVVERESGLAAIGGTSDMKELLAAAPADPKAELAIAVFTRSVKKAIGGYCAVLGGIDLLVFTGGIGEHAATIRERICQGLEAFGIGTACPVRVVETNEELVIARHTLAVVRRRASGPA